MSMNITGLTANELIDIKSIHLVLINIKIIVKFAISKI
jgi:hypothetical protein